MSSPSSADQSGIANDPTNHMNTVMITLTSFVASYLTETISGAELSGQPIIAVSTVLVPIPQLVPHPSPMPDPSSETQQIPESFSRFSSSGQEGQQGNAEQGNFNQGSVNQGNADQPDVPGAQGQPVERDSQGTAGQRAQSGLQNANDQSGAFSNPPSQDNGAQNDEPAAEPNVSGQGGQAQSNSQQGNGANAVPSLGAQSPNTPIKSPFFQNVTFDSPVFQNSSVLGISVGFNPRPDQRISLENFEKIFKALADQLENYPDTLTGEDLADAFIAAINFLRSVPGTDRVRRDLQGDVEMSNRFEMTPQELRGRARQLSQVAQASPLIRRSARLIRSPKPKASNRKRSVAARTGISLGIPVSVTAVLLIWWISMFLQFR